MPPPPPPPPPPGFDQASSISNIDPTEEAGRAAFVGFPTIANAPDHWSSDWANHRYPEDLVSWASDQYLSRKWEINKVFKVPGGRPRPLMFDEHPSVVFEMDGSFHVWGDEHVLLYGRFEVDGPFENILANWGMNHIVPWEMRFGDSDVFGESQQYIDFCLLMISGLIPWS